MLNLCFALSPFVFLSLPRFSNGSFCFGVSPFISFYAFVSPLIWQRLSFVSLVPLCRCFYSSVYLCLSVPPCVSPGLLVSAWFSLLRASQSRHRPSAAGSSHEAHSGTECEGRRRNFAIYVAAVRPAKEGRNMAPNSGKHGRYCAVPGLS